MYSQSWPTDYASLCANDTLYPLQLALTSGQKFGPPIPCNTSTFSSASTWLSQHRSVAGLPTWVTDTSPAASGDGLVLLAALLHIDVSPLTAHAAIYMLVGVYGTCTALELVNAIATARRSVPCGLPQLIVDDQGRGSQAMSILQAGIRVVLVPVK